MQPKLNYLTPPKAAEIELRALAALIHIGNPNNLRVQQAMLKLNEYCFEDSRNRKLFQIQKEIFERKELLDFVSFIEHVPDDIYEVVHLLASDNYLTAHHLEHDVEKLIAYRAWRAQLRILIDAANDSLDCFTPEESLETIRNKLQEIAKTTSTAQASIVRPYEVIADDYLMEPEGEDSSEFKVDIPHLPKVPNRSLITIAGRSGHGKTFFALYLMDKIIDAHPNKQTLYFNLEMHERVMMERHATLLGIEGKSRREIINQGAHKLIPKNVSLISQPMITIDEIETICRLASMKQPLAVIVVDYLGLIRAKSKYESNHLLQNDVAKRLASLSIELDCVVIALIQVNRDIKNRIVGDRCPIPTDSADAMGSVHSSSWWLGIDQPQNDDASPEFKHLFQVCCRKNRGDSGMFKLDFKFTNGMFFRWGKPYSANRTSNADGF